MQMAQHKISVVHAAGLISALTMLSRVLGLVRDCLCAAIFGGGVVWDAFSFAFRIPNLFRRLFGEGALSAAFVPLFTEALESDDPEAARAMAGRVYGSLAVLLILLLLVGEALCLGLDRWAVGSARWHLALRLTAVLLPYMTLICLTALVGAMLHAHGRFAAPAFAPVVLNVCWIAAALVAARASGLGRQGQIYVVAGGIVLAGGFQLWLQLAALRAAGFQLRAVYGFAGREVRQLAAAMGPAVLGMAALQLNVLLDGVIAISLAGPAAGSTFEVFSRTIAYPMVTGANSVLYYGARLMQLPLGVFGIAVATAAFPALSRHAARAEWRQFSAAFRGSLGLVIFIGLPAGVGMMVLAEPIVRVVFERGAFVPETTARTARALYWYAAGIWAYSVLHVLNRAFYSVRRAGTPALVAAAMVLVNVGLNLTLVWFMAESGLAAATAVCAVLQAGVLYAILRRIVSLEGLGALAVSAAKSGLAAACMAGVCTALKRLLPSPGPEAPFVLQAGWLAVLICAGGIVYVAASALLRNEDMRAAFRAFLRRQPSSGPSR
jgi:putative peptidoglycan lipid II flippase